MFVKKKFVKKQGADLVKGLAQLLAQGKSGGDLVSYILNNASLTDARFAVGDGNVDTKTLINYCLYDGSVYGVIGAIANKRQSTGEGKRINKAHMQSIVEDAKMLKSNLATGIAEHIVEGKSSIFASMTPQDEEVFGRINGELAKYRRYLESTPLKDKDFNTLWAKLGYHVDVTGLKESEKFIVNALEYFSYETSLNKTNPVVPVLATCLLARGLAGYDEQSMQAVNKLENAMEEYLIVAKENGLLGGKAEDARMLDVMTSALGFARKFNDRIKGADAEQSDPQRYVHDLTLRLFYSYANEGREFIGLDKDSSNKIAWVNVEFDKQPGSMMEPVFADTAYTFKDEKNILKLLANGDQASVWTALRRIQGLDIAEDADMSRRQSDKNVLKNSVKSLVYLAAMSDTLVAKDPNIARALCEGYVYQIKRVIGDNSQFIREAVKEAKQDIIKNYEALTPEEQAKPEFKAAREFAEEKKKDPREVALNTSAKRIASRAQKSSRYPIAERMFLAFVAGMLKANEKLILSGTTNKNYETTVEALGVGDFIDAFQATEWDKLEPQEVKPQARKMASEFVNSVSGKKATATVPSKPAEDDEEAGK